MKKIVLFLLLSSFTLLSINAEAQYQQVQKQTETGEIKWVTFKELAKLQRKDPRKVMIDFYTPWCGFCKKMNQTYTDKKVADFVNENFYAIKFNAQHDGKIKFKGKEYENPNFDPAKGNKRNATHELANSFTVRAYPTILFLDEKLTFIQKVPGYKNAEKFIPVLQNIKKGKPLKPTATVKRQMPQDPKETGEIKWVTFKELKKLQRKDPRKVMIDFYTPWCGPCKMLDRYTFNDKKVADYVNENFYAVKFNAQHDGKIKYRGKKYENPNFDAAKGQKRRNTRHELAQSFKVTAFPTILFLDEEYQEFKRVKGFKKPDKFVPFLERLIAEQKSNTSSK